MLELLLKDVKAMADPQRAIALARYFKTGKGQYGEGDIFCGLTVPESRQIATKYKTLPLTEISQLINSKIHEERLIALLILVAQFANADKTKQEAIVDFYLSHTKFINNWDLVDLSADKIVGEYLFVHGTWQEKKSLQVLTSLARSNNIWEKRISMLSTFAYIKRGDATMTYAIAEILLHDSHDLIQKAVGWLLREAGKRVSEPEEEAYLKNRYKTMPRTTLRYAIERFPEEKRKKYLTGKV